jgi:nucleoside-diphosphate-sugar epimerase
MGQSKILITGASGFLGSTILRKFVNDGYSVVALVRENSNLKRINDIADRYQLFRVDKHFNNLNLLFETYDIETIIHTATEYGRNSKISDIYKTNFIFSMRLVELGIENGLRYFMNSDSFFGKTEFQGVNYMRDYTLSKRYFLDYLINNSDRLKVVNLRLEHVFGEFDSDTKFVTNVFHKLVKSECVTLITDGSQKRDFVYVEDAVSAYISIFSQIDKIDNLAEFQIGRGESVSLRQFVQLMANVTKSKSILRFGDVRDNKNDIKDSVANLKPLQYLGWKSCYDLSSAIKKMLILELKK